MYYYYLAVFTWVCMQRRICPLVTVLCCCFTPPTRSFVCVTARARVRKTATTMHLSRPSRAAQDRRRMSTTSRMLLLLLLPPPPMKRNCRHTVGSSLCVTTPPTSSMQTGMPCRWRLTTASRCVALRAPSSRWTAFEPLASRRIARRAAAALSRWPIGRLTASEVCLNWLFPPSKWPKLCRVRL